MGPTSIIGAATICLSLFSITSATEFTVGDSDIWTYYMQNWPEGKSFTAGDVLVFNYSPEDHNVVAVDAAGFHSCQPSPGSQEFHSGYDRVTLTKGDNYFLCSLPGHCDRYEMRIAVHAE